MHYILMTNNDDVVSDVTDYIKGLLLNNPDIHDDIVNPLINSDWVSLHWMKGSGTPYMTRFYLNTVNGEQLPMILKGVIDNILYEDLTGNFYFAILYWEDRSVYNTINVVEYQVGGAILATKTFEIAKNQFYYDVHGALSDAGIEFLKNEWGFSDVGELGTAVHMLWNLEPKGYVRMKMKKYVQRGAPTVIPFEPELLK